MPRSVNIGLILIFQIVDAITTIEVAAGKEMTAISAAITEEKVADASIETITTIEVAVAGIKMTAILAAIIEERVADVETITTIEAAVAGRKTAVDLATIRKARTAKKNDRRSTCRRRKQKKSCGPTAVISVEFDFQDGIKSSPLLVFRFSGVTKGINFKDYKDIQVKVTGENPPQKISSFSDAQFRDLLMSNLRKCHYEEPTPVQQWAIPIIMDGRDLMATAQTGSGKTVSICPAGFLTLFNKRI